MMQPETLVNYVEETEREKKRIFSIAKSRFHLNNDIIEDIYQDSYLNLLNGGIKYYDDTKKFLPWFITCFLRKCIDYLRKRKISRKIEYIGEFDERKYVRTNSHSLEIKTDDIEKNEILNKVNNLKPLYRDLIKSYYWDDMSQGAIAKKTKVPKPTILYRLRVSVKKLKPALKEFADQK
mgnify:FL=1